MSSKPLVCGDSPCVEKRPIVRQPEDVDLPGIAVLGAHQLVAAFLVYVDDFLATGPCSVLQPLLNYISGKEFRLTFWDTIKAMLILCDSRTAY